MEQLTFAVIAGQVTAFVAILALVAVFAEGIVEGFQSLIKKIADVSLRTLVNILAASAVGVLAAWGMGLKLENYLTFVPPTIPAFANYILIGIAAGAGGSRFWHAVLGFLGKFKLPTPPTA